MAKKAKKKAPKKPHRKSARKAGTKKAAPTPNTRLPLVSRNDRDERLAGLRELFPEAFPEGELDLGRLEKSLKAPEEDGRERYGLSWAGKAEALRLIQSPTTGSLIPNQKASVGFEDARNVFIEGENLEVLKLLQRSYYGRVRMIYIDPPYNTGKEFLYSDDYREGLDRYLRLTGQKDEAGVRLTTNPETGGRYHSRWLSMMYPRLFLARNLLADDGVIFVSIDDHELHNLRLLMDEIFGPENFVATVIWQKVYAPKNTARQVSTDHDYIVVYARRTEVWGPELLPRTEAMEARYANPDKDSRGPWMSDNLTARNYYSQGTYAVTTPSGRKISGPPAGTYWRVSKRKFDALDADNRIWWGERRKNMPRLKRFLSEVKEGRVPQTLWTYDEVGHTQEAKKELLGRVKFSSSDSVFHTPKPTRLIERMLRIGTRPDQDDVVLDFFAGSGTTGEAVMKLNAADGGDRRFILVQFPEPTGDKKHPTISDIARARLRSAITAIRKEAKGQAELMASPEGSLGFRVYRLSTSCFKLWNAEAAPKDPDELAEQLKLYADHVLPGRSDEEVLHELVLKSGLPLSARVEKRKAAKGSVYSIEENELLVCLDDPVHKPTLRAIIEMEPRRVLCLDHAFRGNDQLKTNTALEMRSHGIEFHTV